MEGAYRKPDGYMELGYLQHKNNSYIIGPMLDPVFRIQSLRMLSGFDREYIAALIGVTRKTYSKLESEAFSNGLERSVIENLEYKTRERLYTKGENPKFAELWKFFIPQTKTALEPIDEKDKLGNYEFFKKTLDEIDKDKIPDLKSLINKRKKDLYQRDNSNETNFIYHIHSDTENKDVHVLRQQNEIIDRSIKETNQELVELLAKSKYLLQKTFENALPDGLWKKYIDNPERHRDTVDDYLKEAGLESSKYFDKKNEEILQTMTYIMFLPNENW